MSRTRSNEEWLHDLRASGSIQEAALADLRELLLRAALYFFSRNLVDLRNLNHDEINQRAEDCAQDAQIAVINHLGDFRGDSKFTTWAYKFAINMALMAARREPWKNISLDELASSEESDFFEWLVQDKSEGSAPERSAMQAEVKEILLRVIQQDLTEKQRQVVSMMVIHEVPLDEMVRYLGSNRNAVYKLLHDARRKLKSGLEARGFGVDEALTLFERPR